MFSITFLVLISFLLVNGSSIGPSEKLASQNRQAVEVYYESLCPNSKQFISEQLPKLASGFDQHVKINLIPYGKADVILYSFLIDSNSSLLIYLARLGSE